MYNLKKLFMIQSRLASGFWASGLQTLKRVWNLNWCLSRLVKVIAKYSSNLYVIILHFPFFYLQLILQKPRLDWNLYIKLDFDFFIDLLLIHRDAVALNKKTLKWHINLRKYIFNIIIFQGKYTLNCYNQLFSTFGLTPCT